MKYDLLQWKNVNNNKKDANHYEIISAYKQVQPVKLFFWLFFEEISCVVFFIRIYTCTFG